MANDLMLFCAFPIENHYIDKISSDVAEWITSETQQNLFKNTLNTIPICNFIELQPIFAIIVNLCSHISFIFQITLIICIKKKKKR